MVQRSTGGGVNVDVTVVREKAYETALSLGIDDFKTKIHCKVTDYFKVL